MKNKRAFQILPILLISAIVISLSACGDQSSKIIGKWKIDKIFIEGKIVENVGWPGKGAILEFYKDKSFVLFDNGNSLFSGSWEDLEGGRIKMTYANPSEVNIATLQGDTLKAKIVCGRGDSGWHNTEAIFKR